MLCVVCVLCVCCVLFFFQAEDGIRDLVRSRGLGDVYKRQGEAYILLGRRPQREDAERGHDPSRDSFHGNLSQLLKKVPSPPGMVLDLSLIHI